MRAGQNPPWVSRHWPAILAVLPLVSLMVTVAFGALLRWVLAGRGMPFGDFMHVRSAHSHLGFYGVLFPLVWQQWRRMGERVPGGWVMVAYSLATGAATVDFVVEGYALISIVGSSVVLVVWLACAWPLRKHWKTQDGLAPVFPSVVCAAVAIPVVAILTRQSNPLAMDWVHAFLTWLLLGVAGSTALKHMEVTTPLPVWPVFVTLGSGLALGPLQGWPFRSVLVLEGLLFFQVFWSKKVSADLRCAWSLSALGLVLVGLGWLQWTPVTAVAGIHFMVLGPLLGTMAWPALWRSARPYYLILVAVFSGLVAMTGWQDWKAWPFMAAIVGTWVALVWWVVVMWLRPCTKTGRGLVFGEKAWG